MHIRYGFARKSFDLEERDFIRKTLNHQQGWVQDGHVFEVVQNHDKRDVVIHLQDRATMRKLFPQKYLRNLSVTDMRNTPFHIHIDRLNWNNVPRDFEGTLETYRQYLIQHEMGHVLGHGHQPPPRHSHKPCPVMMQQTKGTKKKCRANPWGGKKPKSGTA